MNKLGQWVLNMIVGVFFFFVFLFFLFPFDATIQHFLSQVESDTNGAYRITVSEIHPSLLFKTVFKGFQIHHRGVAGDEIWVDLPEVRIGLRYLPLLADHFQASYVAKGKKGSMEGNISLILTNQNIPGAKNGEKQKVITEGALSASIDGIQFDDFPFLAKGFGATMQGSIDGKIDLTWDNLHINRNKGSLDLKLKNVLIAAGRFTPYSGFDLDLPETLLTDAKGGILSLRMEGGKLDVQGISLSGGDLNVNLKGKLQINKKFFLSRFNLDGNFQLSKKLEEAFPFVIFVEKQKNEDGSYPLSLSGTLAKVQLQVGTFEVLK